MLLHTGATAIPDLDGDAATDTVEDAALTSCTTDDFEAQFDGLAAFHSTNAMAIACLPPEHVVHDDSLAIDVCNDSICSNGQPGCDWPITYSNYDFTHWLDPELHTARLEFGLDGDVRGIAATVTYNGQASPCTLRVSGNSLARFRRRVRQRRRRGHHDDYPHPDRRELQG